ncbi:glycerophosphodiester phosphodiesterase [Spiroplasma melliferum]|uniref:Glycerophosphodiester phosphodiesterase n=2 Tax=Spiroplasma melliferum TaxID=2134 RepID=A0AAI9X101_SPIME|nr:glycerophosphodiester phosphodiesterase family protein [Spiroplasma melliferum]KAI92573.1 glycerophosphodiester phosphodiesterase [Spiroplasma melliferum KC3]QCO24163.1 glycerophosphoryl diester phosphodiesterase [Spiroplasma melliferum]
MLVAHRGFRSPAGENRMVDFINALQICRGVEFDIRMTKDQKIIIFHDHNFKRIGNVNKTVRSFTYQEIKTIDFFVKNPAMLPPLFIEDFGNKIAEQYQLINVEIKPDRYTPEEFEMLKNALLTLRTKTTAEIIVSSFGHSALTFITTLDKEFKKGYLVESLKDIDEDLIQHFDYLHPSIDTAKQKKNVPVIKKLNLPLNLWTFKNNKDVKAINNLYDKTFIHGYISDIATLNPNLR